MKKAKQLVSIVIVIQAFLLTTAIGNGADIEIEVDIKPTSCPNPINVKSRGVLPVAILGTEDFDVSDIDVASLRLEGVAPIRSGYEDVSTPLVEGEACDCNTEGPDGFLDLTLKFNTQEIIAALDGLSSGDELELQLTGATLDGIPFEGVDCVIVVGPSNPG
ncbi:MAG: hypothetical protein ACYSPI_13630 [Planctomycetota bacterium]